MSTKHSVVHLGATGAVGTEVYKELANHASISQLTLLGRRDQKVLSSKVIQHIVDISEEKIYDGLLNGHDTAICTLGVGQPSKVSKEEFIRIDKSAVILYAKKCKEAGIQHFLLLSSIGANTSSKSFFLRTKGELIEELAMMGFHQLSIFEPSMILTPTNRYGYLQGIILKLWPKLDRLFIRQLKKYRGIKVEKLGAAIAQQVFTDSPGMHILTREDFQQNHDVDG